jgi:hypothetical protein
VSFHRHLFRVKVGFLVKLLSDLDSKNNSENKKSFHFALPTIKKHTNPESFDDGGEMSLQSTASSTSSSPYPIRHIQYRSSTQILPHMNVSIHKKPVWTPVASSTTSNTMSRIFLSAISDSSKEWVLDTNRPIYKKHCMFWVTADIAHDVYYLWCIKDASLPASEKVAAIKYANILIPNYKTSIFMNNLFRNIKENRNLDAIEESDDEDDFENISEDKYVDLEKKIIMKCVFHHKFKKWVPLEAMSDIEENRNRIPIIGQLVRNSK